MGKVKVHVLYCGGWGYGSKYRRLKSEIIDEFGEDDLDFEGESTPGVSGYLEVSVNGKLIHSKKNGDGYVDSKEKLQKIINGVQEALKAWVMIWKQVK